MHFVIITGLSGAGRSTAIKYMEELGFFCIDNLPPSLIPKFAEVCSHSEGKIDKVAIVVDSRVGYLLKDLFIQLSCLKDMGHTYEIIFLEASDDVLVKRFKEKRKTHPLSPEGRIIRGVREERRLLRDIKARANHIIDTTNLVPKQLNENLTSIFIEGKKFEGLIISILSFGFKYGLPIDIDLVFDVRFIPNPFYIDSMRKLSGLNEKVRDYVLGQEQTKGFLDKIDDMLEFLIPNYIKEGKSQLVIGIGCTGGQHRSVAISEALKERLIKKGHKVIIDHRDLERDNRGI